MNKKCRWRKETKLSERAQETDPAHHAFTEGAGGYLLMTLCPDEGMGVNKANILTVSVSAL